MSERATRTTDPLDRPVDFRRFGPVRRNAFAGAGERGGPSLLALWEMPELPRGVALVRRGRAEKGKTGPTRARSIRLPESVWRRVETAARAKHLGVEQAMRAALLSWLRRAG